MMMSDKVRRTCSKKTKQHRISGAWGYRIKFERILEKRLDIYFFI